MSLAAGTRLGPYEVLAALGAGGMGEVYRARDTRLDRDVAIKVLPEHLADDAASLSRFEREAKAIAAISHPNILAIHDFGTEGGVTFAVTELLEGETLRARLAGGAFPWRHAVEIGAAVAEGLGAAHGRGIVHRDLKPENVFLTSDGRVKILDFGLARRESHLVHPEHTTAPTVTQQTMPGTVMGTVGYMSPEQVTGSPGDARSDIFSFGCVLYEMVTGARTFSGRTGAETLSSILRDEPPDPRQTQRELPADVARVILHCLKKEPDQRFQSARDLAFDLNAILAGSAVTAPAAPLVDSRGRLLRRAGAAVAAAAILLAAGYAISRLSHGSGPAGGGIRSLAVLPFANAGSGPDAGYLGDGLTESLIEQLSRVPALKVMARATVSRYRGNADPQDSGKKLGVGAVLTGDVSRRNDQLSVSAELIETSTGARLWGEKYDRPLDELIRVQDSIAAAVAQGLRLELSDEERRALNLHGTQNPEAYELALKARHFFEKATEEANSEAQRLYLEAVEKDPKFAEAHIGAAATYATIAVIGYGLPAEAWARQKEEMDKALALDPGNVLVRAARAHRRFYFDWDWSGCEAEYRDLATDARLLRTDVWRPIALYDWARGRTEDAIALTERALRIDPGNVAARLMHANLLTHASRFGDAIAEYRSIADADRSSPDPMYGLAEALRRKGDLPGAIGALRKAYELSGEEEGAKALASASTAKDYENAEAAVARGRLEEVQGLAGERYVSPLDVARLQAQAGEREKAFESLAAALAERSPGLVFLKADRAWGPVRDDPRFESIVRRVGIP
jgi:eukaryotic-like serine/threonine-protein kinase